MLEPPNPPKIDFLGGFFFLFFHYDHSQGRLPCFQHLLCREEWAEGSGTLYEKGRVAGAVSLSISSCRIVSDWPFFFPDQSNNG